MTVMASFEVITLAVISFKRFTVGAFVVTFKVDCVEFIESGTAVVILTVSILVVTE